MDVLSTVTVVAHAGHWLLSLVYVAPVLAVVGFIVRQNRQDRRHGADGAADAPDRVGTGEPAASAGSAGPTPQGD